MMNRILHFILITIVLSAFSGCKDDENYNTLHPDEGGIILTMDWSSNIEDVIPPTYQVDVITASGKNKSFENLSETTLQLVVEPGDAMLYIYNNAGFISVSEEKALISNVGTGIAPNPGLFYTYTAHVYTERDQDINHTALMKRQTGELKISIAVKPATMLDKVKTIKAELNGMASELNMQTNILSAPATTSFTFSRNSYYATAVIQTFGFVPSEKQQLRLDLEFENGNTTNLTSDLTPLLDGFQLSKNSLFSLNASLYVDENASSASLSNWERNAESRYLSVFPSEINLPYTTCVESVNIVTDQSSWEFSVVNTGDWLNVTKAGTQLIISAIPNTDKDIRQATIHISAGGLSESITISQNVHETEYYSDKEVVKLQSATTGNGVNIVMMGDGYTSIDMAKETGKYEQDMRAATKHFFSVYPYTEYRDHFNVYMVTAISNEEGISIRSTNTKVDTRFESVWEGGLSTGINCSLENVVEYLNAVTELESADINDISVIMPINASIYAGTCAMYLFNPLPAEIGYGEGFSISMCPVGSAFEKIVVHEGAGHGFSKVTDEYIYYSGKTIPEEDKDIINNFKTYGWCENVDFYSDIKQTSWKGFADNPKYNMVAAFEGADMYAKGIWRPEYNSCMNDNVPYFNAPTRWAQVRRIKKLAGFNYSLSQFLRDDLIPEYPSDTRSHTKNLKPLGAPVMKILDKSRIKRW